MFLTEKSESNSQKRLLATRFSFWRHGSNVLNEYAQRRRLITVQHSIATVISSSDKINF